MKRIVSLLLAAIMIISLLPVDFLTASAASYTYNWGTREVEATALSDAASAWYEDNNTSIETLLTYSGSSSTSSVPSSALYGELQTLMTDAHSTKTSYDATRYMFCYTDCQNGGGKISSFYSGTEIGPDWNSGSTWNREHTWPNSKGLGGSDENDIMMLRPTSVSENSSRGNTAYGESSGYYHPNSEADGAYDLRGDVARIMLYVYVRWGNTSYMWGSFGVMESKEVLLTWMEEDPVDTWELGRNDSVASITGTRNVFVDYPELAFALFDEDIPVMTTPSGYAATAGFTVTATSNNDSYGTVSVSGNTITAVPATGYFASGYTVTGGSASVAQNGNVFTVTATADCSVQINFAAASACSVIFNEANTSSSVSSYSGENITMPAASGTVDEGYTFKGWVSTQVENSESAPETIYAAGDSYSVTGNAVFYALYTYTTASDDTSSSNEYTLYSGDLTEGDYVIVYNTYAMTSSVSSNRFTNTNVTFSDNTVVDPDVAIIWHIAPSGDYWTIYNANSQMYAASTGAKNKAQLLSSVNDYCTWDVTGNSTYEFKNTYNSSKNINALLRNNGTYGFACYSSSTGGALSLYKASSSSGTTYYTTVIGVACEHSYEATVTSPTCEAQGYTTYTCSLCSYSYIADYLPATGHSYNAVVTKPTCTEQGYTTYTCACGNSYVEYTDATGHDYVLNNGVYTCGNCGHSYETYYISFSVPEGVDEVSKIEYTDGGITLPYAGVPADGDYEYTFVGWTTAELADASETAPVIYKASATFEADAATTLYALYTYTDGGSGEGETTWNLVTDASTLAAGDEFVIVATASEYGLSTTQNSNNRGQAVVTKDSDNTVTFGDTVQVLTLQAGNVSGTFAFYTGSGYLYAASSSSNYLRTETTLSNNSSWTISIDDGVATIKAQGANTRNWLRYNSSSTIFSCYSNGQADISIYKKYETAFGTTYYTTVGVSSSSSCDHSNTTTTITDASCAAAGSTVVSCIDCGYMISTTEIQQLDHSYEAVVTTPSCENDGYTTYTCSVCGDTYTGDTVDAIGHNYTSVVTTEATCTTDGLRTYTCQNDSSHTYTEVISATGHSYVDGECENCGAAKPKVIEYKLIDIASVSSGNYIIGAVRSDAYPTVYLATSSISGDWTVSSTSTTAENDIITEEMMPDDAQVFIFTGDNENGFSIGFHNGTEMVYLGYSSSSSSRKLALSSNYSTTLWKICSDNDGGFYLQTVGSSYTISQNSTAVTAIRGYAGTAVYTGIYLFAESCEHTYGEGVVTAPTCETAGYTTYTCTLCGKTYTDNEVTALGHSWDEGTITTAATCTETGVMTFTCAVCYHTYTEVISATGHTINEDDAVIVNATCETDGSKTYTCSVCKEDIVETIPATGHDYAGSVTTAATCDTAGVMTYTCQNDNSHTYTEAIPATGHSYDSTGTCTGCGAQVDHYALVDDYAKILAGGEYVLAVRSGENFYALKMSNESGSVSISSVDITDQISGTGADLKVVWAEDVPTWNVSYYENRLNCFSLYSADAAAYITGTDSTSLSHSTSAWAWTFEDACNEGLQTDGEYAIVEAGTDTVADGATSFVTVSATIKDRGITYRSEDFYNYSVRSSGYNREVYFFKLVKANETEYTVNFVENGITASTVSVPVDENVIEFPDISGTVDIPEGYTKFIGWVTLPHTESLIAPTTIYSVGQTCPITEDTTFYALYTREDYDAEGQALSYHLVTDNNQLVIGQKYIIVGYSSAESLYYAVSGDQLSGDRGASVVTPDSDGVITFSANDNVAVFELTQGYELNSFAFLDLNMSQFLYCASGSDNALGSQSTLDTNASFFIDILSSTDAPYGYYANIAVESDSTDNDTLMFNTTSTTGTTYRLFSCYDDTSTGNDITKTAIYVGVTDNTAATYYTTGLCAHDWVETEKVSATCLHTGYTLYTCSICGEIKIEDAVAHGHNVESYTVIVEPTCTTTGAQEGTCTRCGTSFTEIIPVVDHTPVTDTAVGATCIETGLTEGSHCSVCDNIITPQTTVDALGHSFGDNFVKTLITSSGTEYPGVVHSCSRCSIEETVSELKFVSANIQLGNTFIVDFKAASNILGNGEGFANVKATYTYGKRVGDYAITAPLDEDNTNEDGNYILPCTMITPSQIGDEITAVLTGKFDGASYTFTMTYSVKDYCYNVLKSSTSSTINRLLVDLLYYCDAARTYTTYKADESVTADLTDEQKAYATTTTRTYTSITNASYITCENAAASWQAVSLILTDSISMRFRFKAENVEGLTVKVEIGGVTTVFDQSSFVAAGDNYPNQYYLRFNGIKGNQMSESVYVTVCNGDTAVSNTLLYSVESYACKYQGETALGKLVIAMMNYGDSAADYL